MCEFRARLLAGTAEELLFETLLTWCHERQLVKAGGRQRTDSTQVLAAVRALNRVVLVVEAMRHTLLFEWERGPVTDHPPRVAILLMGFGYAC